MSKSNNDFFKEKKDWSLVKDRLLGCYLAPYFQKVLATGKPICYVDCFSGKGKFEDGNPGSPIIALQTRNKCLQQSRVSIDKRNAISMSFIDLNYACDLQQNLAEFDNTYGKLNIVGGKYEEKILDILKTQKGKNVFLYIDPYGIKALDTDLFKQFNSFGFNTFEMLINFNSFGFFRDACRVMSVDYKSDSALQNLEDLIEYDPSSVASEVDASNLLTRIAGGDYWKDIVRDYKDGKIDGYKAEQRLSTEYKLHLKKYYSYVLDMPIRLKSNSRPKYRMVHVSNHEDGCFLMGQNMQNRKDELYTNIQSGGQLSIFDLVSDLTQSVEGDWIKEEDIKEKIKTEIDNIGDNINITKFIARFINEYGLICDFNFINEELKTLEKTGEIEIVRNPAISEKTKKTLTFMTEDRNHTVIIRRKKA